MSGFVLGKVRDLSTPPSDFFQALRGQLTGGARAVTFYAAPSSAPSDVELTAVLESSGRLHALRTRLEREHGFHTLTRDFPALHIFEREIFEQQGLKPHDHPWLKPVRFSGTAMGQMEGYPFYRIEGKEVHEVAVGPIHAGVIEPGQFPIFGPDEFIERERDRRGLAKQLVINAAGMTAVNRREIAVSAPFKLRRLATARKLTGDANPKHSAATAARACCLAEARIRSEKRREIFIAIEINRAQPARCFAQVNGNVRFLC